MTFWALVEHNPVAFTFLSLLALMIVSAIVAGVMEGRP